MSYERKFAAAITEMEQAGIKKTKLPPIYRFLKKLGYEIKPPLYTPYLRAFLFLTFFYAFFWGLFMVIYMYLIYSDRFSLHDILGIMILPSLGFGLIMTLTSLISVYFKRKKYKLSDWEDL